MLPLPETHFQIHTYLFLTCPPPIHFQATPKPAASNDVRAIAIEIFFQQIETGNPGIKENNNNLMRLNRY